jgi:hypothetical protein
VYTLLREIHNLQTQDRYVQLSPLQTRWLKIAQNHRWYRALYSTIWNYASLPAWVQPDDYVEISTIMINETIRGLAGVGNTGTQGAHLERHQMVELFARAFSNVDFYKQVIRERNVVVLQRQIQDIPVFQGPMDEGSLVAHLARYWPAVVVRGMAVPAAQRAQDHLEAQAARNAEREAECKAQTNVATGPTYNPQFQPRQKPRLQPSAPAPEKNLYSQQWDNYYPPRPSAHLVPPANAGPSQAQPPTTAGTQATLQGVNHRRDEDEDMDGPSQEPSWGRGTT